MKSNRAGDAGNGLGDGFGHVEVATPSHCGGDDDGDGYGGPDGDCWSEEGRGRGPYGWPRDGDGPPP
jgi:hypothetical protein